METDNEKDMIPEGWENPPTLKNLKQDFEDSKPSHDKQASRVRTWLDNLHIEGSAVIKTPDGSSKVQPKLIRKQAEWRYPALSEPFLNTNDMFKIKPKTWEDADAARQNALVLNNQFNTQIDKVDFIDEYVRAAVDEGTVVCRVGWEFEEEETTEQVPQVQLRPNLELTPLHQELARMKAENPTGYKFEVPQELQIAHEASMQSGQPLEPIVTGYDEVAVMKTVRNQPVLEICDYRHVYIDPTCNGNTDKAEFLVFSFETSLSQLKKDGKYRNLENINVSNSSVLGTPDHESEDNENFSFNDDPRKKFVAYEYWGFWDYRDTGVAEPFVATWVGDTLIRLEENPYPDKKIPFVFVSLLPKRKSAYGEPDGELLEDNQKIVGAVTRGMIDIMGKSANGQTGYRKDALDAVNRRKFDQGKDYAYNGGVDPRQAFHMHTFQEIPQSAPFMLTQQSQEAESMTGVKVWGQGITGDALGESVGNGRSVMDAASKRETGILRRLASGVVKIGRKVIAMNGEFLEEEEVVRITNDDFTAVRRDDLAGNFDMELDISTVEEDDAKAQELAFMLQTMGNNMDAGMTNLILRDIARLRKMPELAHAIENFEPQPDPVQQQLQQLEIQLKQAEIAKVMSETQENYANAQLDGAKAGESQAKTRLMGSQADNADLDFVETESGVKQEREKELHGEQARSNMELEKFKHGLKESSERKKELSKYLSANNSEK